MEVSCFVVKVRRSFTDLAVSISRGVPFQDVAKAGLKFGDEGIFQLSKDSFF
jgi:hypothetical protein